MKLFTVHRNTLNINYKHQLCSIAFLFVILVTILTIVLPFVVIHSTNRETWKQSLMIYEQPNVKFIYQYIFTAILQDDDDDKKNMITCSSFPFYNELTQEFQECSDIKVIFD